MGQESRKYSKAEVDGHLLIVTINRPEVYNALHPMANQELSDIFDEFAANPELWVAIITGAGDKAFSAGNDLKYHAELRAKTGGRPHSPPKGFGGLTNRHDLDKPVIAAVNGVAAGAGANLALACDVRLASDAAKLGETFVRIGLHPDWAGTWHLPRLAGVAKSLDLCWTGDLIEAGEAQRLGLFQRVWPAASFEREWRDYAARLAAGPQVAIRAAKASLRAAPGRGLEECLAAERAAQERCWQSPDAAEGVRAFVEKRAPVFASSAPPESDLAPSRAARTFE